MDNINNTYQDIITLFVLNIMLQFFGMLWIIETHKQLKYDMDKYNSDWMTGGPWYNTSICKNIYGTVFEGFIRKAITDRYIIMCSIDAHEKLIHQNMMMEAEVADIHYHRIQQQKHYICSVQP